VFSPDDIKARVRVQPFVPFRIVTSAGQTFDVYHPDLVLVGRRDLIVGRASTEDAETYEQTTRLALMHVTALEDLPVPTLPTSNGVP
jgi:hypothetical protein